MSPAFRRKTILMLLARRPAATQEELQHALSKRGIIVAQATLSRDLNALGMVKSSRGYQVPKPINQSQSITQQMMADFVASVRIVQNLLVLKTVEGTARLVAAALEEENSPDGIGVIAGQDTILVVCAHGKEARKLAARIRTEFGPDHKHNVWGMKSIPEKLPVAG
jgi:transcriptional regulator of arginine metabolism